MLKKILKKFLKREHWGYGSWTLRFSIPLFKYQSRFDKLYARRYDPSLSIDSKKEIINRLFKERLGYEMDWNNPKTFNQKLNWLKLYYYNPLMTICADKYAVHHYIKERLPKEASKNCLIPRYGVWDKPEDIPFGTLPDRFALKVNWGAGQNIIVKDRKNFEKNSALEKLKRWMEPHSNNYFGAFERGYKNISPKIVCEEFLDTGGEELLDYKIFCFNGKAEFIQLEADILNASHTRCFYDRDWIKMPVESMYKLYDKKTAPPKNLDKMLAYAEALASPFPFARVDWYEIKGQLKFGEITFYNEAGFGPFNPPEWDRKFGDLLTLPKTNI